MSDGGTEAYEGYTVSFKTDESYSAALVVVRGEDAVALRQNIDALSDDLIQAIVDTRQVVLAANRVAAGTSSSAQSAAVTQSQPAATQQQGSPDVKTCAHGVRQYREGQGRTGKWAAYMCPQPKNASDKCDPLWVND